MRSCDPPNVEVRTSIGKASRVCDAAVADRFSVAQTLDGTIMLSSDGNIRRRKMYGCVVDGYG